jgi:hypothetical protein
MVMMVIILKTYSIFQSKSKPSFGPTKKVNPTPISNLNPIQSLALILIPNQLDSVASLTPSLTPDLPSFGFPWLLWLLYNEYNDDNDDDDVQLIDLLISPLLLLIIWWPHISSHTFPGIFQYDTSLFYFQTKYWYDYNHCVALNSPFNEMMLHSFHRNPIHPAVDLK